MTEIANVYTALAAAQLEFGAVQKGSVNPAFKTRYADLADVSAVVIPTLARHGVAVLHYPVWREDVNCMRTEFMHGASASRVWCDVPLIVDRQNMQGYKSATTYAKRIGLESLSGVAPEDDDGNAAAAAPRQQRQEPRRTEPEQPRFDAKAAAARVAKKIEAARTLPDLSEVWRAEWDCIVSIKAADADECERLTKIKDARKAALTGPDPARQAPADDLADIPY